MRRKGTGEGGEMTRDAENVGHGRHRHTEKGFLPRCMRMPSEPNELSALPDRAASRCDARGSPCKAGKPMDPLPRLRASMSPWPLLLCGCLTLSVFAACDRSTPQPAAAPVPVPPQVSGTLAVGGLTAPVRVVRDRWGVPHIY